MWTIRAKSDTSAELMLYDVIGDDGFCNGVTARDMIEQVKALGDIKHITLRVNSAGGDVFEAQAMFSYLREHQAEVTVVVDGLAASAASLVAMAGDTVVMPENALMMIHNPATMAVGEAEDMRHTADVLDKVRDTLASAYEAKTGLARDQIIEMMNEETWMTAGEAYALKFCDKVAGAVKIAACAGRVTCGGLTAELTAKQKELLPERYGGKVSAEPALLVNTSEEADMEIKNVAEMEREYPSFVAELKSAADIAGYERGVAEERERLKLLDSLMGPGREAVLARAKYDEPKDARDVAIELLTADASHAELSARALDAAAVTAALEPQAAAPRGDEHVSAIADRINRMRGYK